MNIRTKKTWGPPHPFQGYMTGSTIERPVSDSTARLYARAVFRLEESGKDPIEWFNEQARDPELSKKTLDILRSTVAHYMVWKGTADNKASALGKLSGTSRGRGERRKEALSEDEVQDLLVLVDGITEPIPTFLKLLLCTGLRVSEGCDLVAEDIVLSGRNPHLEVRRGKGNKPRTVELGHDAVGLLKPYLKEQRKKGGPLFPWAYMVQEDGEFLRTEKIRPLQPYVVRRELQAAREEKDLLPQVTPHILRHTLATDMLEAGGSLKHIQKALGHKGLNVLERYLTIRPDQMHTVLDKMPQRWSKDPEDGE